MAVRLVSMMAQPFEDLGGVLAVQREAAGEDLAHAQHLVHDPVVQLAVAGFVVVGDRGHQAVFAEEMPPGVADQSTKQGAGRTPFGRGTMQSNDVGDQPGMLAVDQGMAERRDARSHRAAG